MTPSDVKIVAENINDFIEVPDGINRLRKAVLTLAVSGQLVEQNENEGTADQLYAQIKAEYDKIEEVSRKKNIKKLHPITDEEVPFDIPKTWKWVRLGDVTNYGSTDKCKPSDLREGVWVLELEDLEKDGGRLLSVVRYPERLSLSDKNVFKKNDVLYGKLRPYLNKVIVAMEDGVSSSELLPVRWSADPEFLRLVLLSDYFSSYVNSITYGVKMPRLGTEDGRNALFPLAPLSEQKRIVKRVNEVMSQLDELESQKNERDFVRSRLTRSAMQVLSSADPKIAFDQLTELIKTPQDVKELENAILTLAVSGQLVIQDDSEGSANDLYKKIQSEIKTNLKGKEQKLVTAVSADEIPFEIPESWRWVRLIEIGKLDTGKTPRTNVTGNYDGDIPFIGPGDVQNGTINSYSKLVTVQGASESKYLYPGDVLMVCIGGTIGKTAYVNETYTFNQQINKITPFHTDGRYLSFVFKTEYFQKLVWGKASGGATPLVNLTRWSSCIVPLPPLAEQKRIVAKVEELLKMLNSLRSIIDD